MSSNSPKPSKAALICLALCVVNLAVAACLLIRSYLLPSDISAASQSFDLLMQSRSKAGSIRGFLLLIWGWSYLLIYFVYKGLINAGMSPADDATFFEKDNRGERWIGRIGALSLLVVLTALFGIVYRDYQEVNFWRKTADHGVAYAQDKLGEMYANGQGVPKDDTEAARWYRKAADQGHESAQYKLGEMYASGQGVPKDDTEAYHWFNSAAHNGHRGAIRRVEMLNKRGTLEQIETARDLKRRIEEFAKEGAPPKEKK